MSTEKPAACAGQSASDERGTLPAAPGPTDCPECGSKKGHHRKHCSRKRRSRGNAEQAAWLLVADLVNPLPAYIKVHRSPERIAQLAGIERAIELWRGARMIFEEFPNDVSRWPPKLRKMIVRAAVEKAGAK